MGWQVFAAACTGTSHVEIGLPCQDAFAHQLVGDVLCAVVCDGAGSAAFSHFGAQHVTQRIVQELAKTLQAGVALHTLPVAELRAVLLVLIGQIRAELLTMAVANAADLGDYACTLVGTIAAQDRACLFHIGDGLAIGQPVAAERPALISLPENGEYANETCFVTGEDWQERLRLLLVDESLQTIVLMSDGAMPFVMSRGLTGLFRPFMDPVERFLDQATSEAGNAALGKLLDDPRTHSITSDDKTLLIARWR